MNKTEHAVLTGIKLALDAVTVPIEDDNWDEYGREDWNLLKFDNNN